MISEPKRKRSWIWKYFVRLSSRRYRCTLCHAVLSINTHTTNMNRHVKFKHPNVFNSEIKEKQKNIRKDGVKKLAAKTDEKISVEKVSGKSDEIVSNQKEENYINLAKDDSSINNGASNQENDLALSSELEVCDQQPSWIWTYFETLTTSHYQCDICGRVMIGANNLIRHIRLKHCTLYKSVLRKIKIERKSKIAQVAEVKPVSVVEEVEDLEEAQLVMNISDNAHENEVTSYLVGESEQIGIENPYPDIDKDDSLDNMYIDVAEDEIESESTSTRKRSYVWKYFVKLSARYYRCSLCSVTLSINTHTNNMNRHIKFKHPDIFKAESSRKQNHTNVCLDRVDKLTAKTVKKVTKKNKSCIGSQNKDAKKISGTKTTRRQRRSWIWNYFQRLNTTHYRCDVCERVLAGVYNLNRHIKLKHSTLYMSAVKKKKIEDTNKEQQEAIETLNLEEVEESTLNIAEVEHTSLNIEELEETSMNVEEVEETSLNIDELEETSMNVEEIVETSLDAEEAEETPMNADELEAINLKNLYPNMEKADPINVYIADDATDSSWVWLLIDSSDDVYFYCRICQFQFKKLSVEEENVINILDHLSNEHELMSADQVTIQEDD